MNLAIDLEKRYAMLMQRRRSKTEAYGDRLIGPERFGAFTRIEFTDEASHSRRNC